MKQYRVEVLVWIRVDAEDDAGAEAAAKTLVAEKLGVTDAYVESLEVRTFKP